MVKFPRHMHSLFLVFASFTLITAENLLSEHEELYRQRRTVLRGTTTAAMKRQRELKKKEGEPLVKDPLKKKEGEPLVQKKGEPLMKKEGEHLMKMPLDALPPPPPPPKKEGDLPPPPPPKEGDEPPPPPAEATQGQSTTTNTIEAYDGPSPASYTGKDKYLPQISGTKLDALLDCASSCTADCGMFSDNEFFSGVLNIDYPCVGKCMGDSDVCDTIKNCVVKC